MSFFKKIIDSVSEIISNIPNIGGSISFSKIEQDAIAFVQDNSAKGLPKPIMLEILLKKNGNKCIVKFTAYYQEQSGKYFVREKQGEFEEINSFPHSMHAKYIAQGELKIKIADMYELLSSNEKNVNPSILFKELDGYINTWEKELQSKGKKIKGKKMAIIDKIFRKIVTVSFELEHTEENLKICSVSFSDIKDMPKEIFDLIETDGKVDLQLK